MSTIIDAVKAGGKWTLHSEGNPAIDFSGPWFLINGVSIHRDAIASDKWIPVPEQPPQWCKDAAERYYRPCFPRAKPHDVLELAEIIAEEWREAGKP